MNTIHLLPEQQRILDGQDTTRAIDPRTNTAYVLVREDRYERIKGLLEDDSVFATAEMVDAIMADDDANDPALAYYAQKYGL